MQLLCSSAFMMMRGMMSKKWQTVALSRSMCVGDVIVCVCEMICVCEMCVT